MTINKELFEKIIFEVADKTLQYDEEHIWAIKSFSYELLKAVETESKVLGYAAMEFGDATDLCLIDDYGYSKALVGLPLVEKEH